MSRDLQEEREWHVQTAGGKNFEQRELLTPFAEALLGWECAFGECVQGMVRYKGGEELPYWRGQGALLRGGSHTP